MWAYIVTPHSYPNKYLQDMDKHQLMRFQLLLIILLYFLMLIPLALNSAYRKYLCDILWSLIRNAVQK